jgi:hypothetical protein
VFVGNLTASLTVTDLKAPFRTLGELAANNQYKLLFINGNVQEGILKVFTTT